MAQRAQELERVPRHLEAQRAPQQEVARPVAVVAVCHDQQRRLVFVDGATSVFVRDRQVGLEDRCARGRVAACADRRGRAPVSLRCHV